MFTQPRITGNVYLQLLIPVHHGLPKWLQIGYSGILNPEKSCQHQVVAGDTSAGHAYQCGK